MDEQTAQWSMLLEKWLVRRLEPSCAEWLAKRRRTLAGASRTESIMAFGLAGRRIPSMPLILDYEEEEEARRLGEGWVPFHWNLRQCGRAWLALDLFAKGDKAIIATLFDTGELYELVALYQALPLFPEGEKLCHRAEEAARSNALALFEAVAINNPYPARRFGELQWNHLVLKALFLGCPLDRVIGLDERKNPELARMAVRFARERRAAGRPYPADLWRVVAPFVDGWSLGDVEAALADQDPTSSRAAALAISGSAYPPARELFATLPWRSDIEEGRLTWDNFRHAG